MRASFRGSPKAIASALYGALRHLLAQFAEGEELLPRVELGTSSLPRMRSTTELKQHESGKRDSNPRPPAWKASALSTELFPQIACCQFAGALASASCESKLSLASLKSSARVDFRSRLASLWVRMDSNHRS